MHTICVIVLIQASVSVADENKRVAVMVAAPIELVSFWQVHFCNDFVYSCVNFVFSICIF